MSTSLFERVDSSAGLDACWPWTGPRDPHGYGRQGSLLAHRAFYKQVTGQSLKFVVLRHTCDNTWCCNLFHLVPGTQADNVRDMISRKRQAVGERHGLRRNPNAAARGENHWRARLTISNVITIRQALLLGTTLEVLSRRFGVSISCISKIKRNLSWKDHNV